MASRLVGFGWASLGAAALVAVGVFLPWMSVVMPFVGELTTNGIERVDGDRLFGNDGPYLLAVAAITAYLSVMGLVRDARWFWPAVVGFVVAAYLGNDVRREVSENVEVLKRAAGADGFGLDSNVGGGVWLVLGAAFVGAVSSALAATYSTGGTTGPSRGGATEKD